MAAFTVQKADWLHDAGRLGAIRRTVFVEEQGVPEALEWDADDADALHLLATLADGTPIGCARLLSDGPYRSHGHVARLARAGHWSCLTGCSYPLGSDTGTCHDSAQRPTACRSVLC